MTILHSFISIWKHHSVGTPCNPIHSTASHSPLKVQGCPIVAFAEFKVITVVMTGILFCLRPPCSAPASAAPRILQVGICPRFFVVLVLQSARRSALQCANCRARRRRTAEWCSGVVRQCARRIGGQGRADNREFRAIARGRVTLPECSGV